MTRCCAGTSTTRCRDDYGAGLRSRCRRGPACTTSRAVMVSSRPATMPAEREPVFTWPEGNAWLVERLGSAVARAHPHVAHGAAGSTTERHAVRQVSGDRLSRRSNRLRFEAKVVVLATPLFVARRLWSSAVVGARGRPASVRVTRHGWWPTRCSMRRCSSAPRGATLAWDNVRHGSPSLGYVAAQHQSLRADARATVLTAVLGVGRPRAVPRCWPTTGACVAQRVIDDLAVAHPDLPRKVQRVDLDATRPRDAHSDSRRARRSGAGRASTTRAAACNWRTPTWRRIRCSKRPTRSACRRRRAAWARAAALGCARGAFNACSSARPSRTLGPLAVPRLRADEADRAMPSSSSGRSGSWCPPATPWNIAARKQPDAGPGATQRCLGHGQPLRVDAEVALRVVARHWAPATGGPTSSRPQTLRGTRRRT